MTSVFKTDIDFCPECGSIVPLPKHGYVAECNLCSFKIDISSESKACVFIFQGMLSYSCMLSVDEFSLYYRTFWCGEGNHNCVQPNKRSI